MTIKQFQDNSPKYLFWTAIILVILQGANLVGVANATIGLKHETENRVSADSTLNYKVTLVGKDYLPLWFYERMQQNEDFKIQELIATFTNADKSKIKDINAKYQVFQKDVMNDIIRMRGGYTNISRGVDK